LRHRSKAAFAQRTAHPGELCSFSINFHFSTLSDVYVCRHDSENNEKIPDAILYFRHQSGQQRDDVGLTDVGSGSGAGNFPGTAGDIQIETLFPGQFICLADRRFMSENGMLTLEEWLARSRDVGSVSQDCE
jgi:hypothetical protein